MIFMCEIFAISSTYFYQWLTRLGCVLLLFQVLSEMCVDLRASLEHCKLELTANANRASLDYLQAQTQAMLGKLE